MSYSQRQRSRAVPGAAAALLVALAVGSAARADAPDADAATAGRVMAALHADSHLNARHIEVSAKGGVVRLRGFVESEHDLQLARKDAQAVSGVTSVRDELELKGQERSAPGS